MRTSVLEWLTLPLWLPVLLGITVGWCLADLWSLSRWMGVTGVWTLWREGRAATVYPAYRRWRHQHILAAQFQLVKTVVWGPFVAHLTIYTPWHWKYWWRKLAGVPNGLA